MFKNSIKKNILTLNVDLPKVGKIGKCLHYSENYMLINKGALSISYSF
jgi:hypothetical protein